MLIKYPKVFRLYLLAQCISWVDGSRVDPSWIVYYKLGVFWIYIVFFYKCFVKNFLTNLIYLQPMMPTTVSWGSPSLSGSDFKITLCTAKQHILMYKWFTRCLKLIQPPKTTGKNSLRKVICIMMPWHGPLFFNVIFRCDDNGKLCRGDVCCWSPWSDCK